ncbi:hypothetical protein RWE87_04895 [Sinorhizobium meliloti]|uniref:hypothetical protein n=1 Tax=Rhizobium meliloti TaxID=382 RepID=UPI00299ED671|nr:hypothetical protein [Sinorhizobium meliloti]
MKPAIVPATDEEFSRFYGGMQVNGKWIGRAVKRGRLVSAFGGLIEATEGEWVAFLDIPSHERRPSLYRHIRAAFEDAKAQGAKVIKATCDMSIPRAEALMKHLGFEPTEETHEGKAVWICLVSN